jgi:hypothetical protein
MVLAQSIFQIKEGPEEIRHRDSKLNFKAEVLIAKAVLPLLCYAGPLTRREGT